MEVESQQEYTAVPGYGPPGYAITYPVKAGSPHIGHKHHLCSIVESGSATLDQIKSLVKDPKFVCRVCGRAAANSDNLCEPVSLSTEFKCPTCGMNFNTKKELMEHAKEHKK